MAGASLWACAPSSNIPPGQKGSAGPPSSQPGGVAAIDPSGLEVLLDPVFAKGMADEHIPGAVFILVRDGRVVFQKGYGVADVASQRPFRPDTIFPIASITKVFTSTAVMQLADRGQLDLQADVNRYLKSVRVPDTYPQPITAENLLEHTGGLDEIPGRLVRPPDQQMPLDKFLASRLVRIRAPGELTSYSSYGMALAGLLVQDVSGLPFEEYLTRNIWQPLGMRRSFITVPAALRGEMATPYEIEEDGKAVPIPYEVYHTPPASSIVSTAENMTHFMIAHLQKGQYEGSRILSEKAAELMHQQHATVHPRLPGMAYGFQVSDTNGLRILEHGGDIGGFSSLMVLLPDEGVGFFIADHREGANLRNTVREQILDRYFPDTRPAQKAVPRAEDAESLRRFAGTYRATTFCHSCPDGGPFVQDFEVTANSDGTLTLWDQSWVQAAPLYFVSPDGRRRIGFKEDASGKIVAVSAGSWRVLERLREKGKE